MFTRVVQLSLPSPEPKLYLLLHKNCSFLPSKLYSSFCPWIYPLQVPHHSVLRKDSVCPYIWTPKQHMAQPWIFFLVANMPELKKVEDKSHLNLKCQSWAWKCPHGTSTPDIEAGSHDFEASLGYITSSSFKRLKQTTEHTSQPTLYYQ